MLAAAHDQENLTHAHQQAAAAKPLNQGARGIKTPGNKGPKTPFRIPLNDENAPLKTGKSIVKTNGKGLNGGVKDGKQGKEGGNDAFVTPAGPRNRAPLGMKTTNAKAKAFQTPAPLSIGQSKEQSAAKSLSPRMRRAKVKVHQAETSKVEAEDEELGIEYMPPQPKPLRDDPDDFPADKEYPMFSAENITRGMHSVFSGADDEDFIARREKEEAEAQAKHDHAMDALLQKAIDDDPIIGRANIFEASTACIEPRELGSEPARISATNKKPAAAPTQGPSSATSRSAALALARPTAASAKKAKPALAPRARAVPSQPGAAGNPAASRTTLGYAHGRAASASLRRPQPGSSSDGGAANRRDQTAAPVGSARRPGLAGAGNGRNALSQIDEGREREARKENVRPSARTLLPAQGRIEEELDVWDSRQEMEGGKAKEEEEGSWGDSVAVEEMWRKEAMREFRIELPEGF
ncbi:MAG: hypothetical protein M1822_003217 [Bathelium mastoideum]|nr:MAG: hypothetical protein M1822_003217 [Bathelium mastoideum]